MRLRFAVICAVLVVVGSGPLQVGGADADDAVASAAIAVAVSKATTQCFSSVVRATGYIVPRTTAVVMFNAPGFRIVEVSAQQGDRIKVGDVVAVAAGPASPNPQAMLADSKGALSTRIPIKSLASGLVLSRTVEVGTPTAVAGGPLFTLAVDGEMEALIDVPSVHVLELSAGQLAHVSMDDGREFTAHIRLVPVEVNTVTQVGQARLSIDSEEGLRIGRFVHVTIDARRSCGIGVPLAALTHESDGTRVQVVKNGTIETRVVTLGLLSDTDAEIADGVFDGDLVVSDAGTSLRDGDKVRPIIADLQDQR